MVNKHNNKDNVVVVTGAARRIGAVIARHFHANNYNVIIHYRNSKKEAVSLAQDLNSIRANSAKVIQADLINMIDLKFIKNFIEELIGYYGYINTLVNNASSFFPTVMGTIELVHWRDLMISNAGGAFFLAQGLAPYLKITNGSIINISDIHAVRPLKNYSIYSIAKAANNMITKSLARELAPNIRVNGVAPGPILWPEAENQLNIELQNKIINNTLLKKQGHPADIACAVLFLATSNYITGQILAVDGGRSLRL